MTGAGAVVALVLIEWTTGWLAGSAWTQSWDVVKRGHFRVSAWGILGLAVLAVLANREAVADIADAAPEPALVIALVVGAGLYLLVQYSRTDLPGVVVGLTGAALGAVALYLGGSLLDAWPDPLAALHLIAGAALLGAVTNGMMLGHWYLNQPGLKTWALARLTTASLVATVACGVLGLVTVTKLAGAETAGAVLGISGFGESFGGAFFGIWVALVAFTGVIVFAARRCVKIKSIQSATGLYYVALLTAGVAEFLVRYLMVNAA